jgi:hypothetical protein
MIRVVVVLVLFVAGDVAVRHFGGDSLFSGEEVFACHTSLTYDVVGVDVSYLFGTVDVFEDTVPFVVVAVEADIQVVIGDAFDPVLFVPDDLPVASRGRVVPAGLVAV